MISWGSFQQNGNLSNDQLQLEISIVDQEKCQNKWREWNQNVTSHVCVGGQLGQGTCKGDSGAPLVAPEKNGNRRYFLLGLSSSGIGKCGGGVPDLFTKVSHYREWIMENLI